MRRGRHRGWWAAALNVAVACGPTHALPGDDGGASWTDTNTAPTEPPSGTTDGGTTTADPDDGETSRDDGNGFVFHPDGGLCGGPLPPGVSPHCTECDTTSQDCPGGEKCTARANDGGNTWNATVCSPVVEDPAQVGESCTVQGSNVSGLDDCAFGAMCFYVEPDTLQGRCVPQCLGSGLELSCPRGTSCSISGEGSLALCLPPCDPLGEDCWDGVECVPDGSVFLCLPLRPETAADGDACESETECPSGSACVAADLIGCDTPDGCCSPLCNLTLDEPSRACLDPAHGCLPWYEAGEAPSGFDHVGVCGLPA